MQNVPECRAERLFNIEKDEPGFIGTRDDGLQPF
jgi:hypothetical protein